MLLTFKGGSELVRLDIDRANKILHIESSRTNYQRQRIPYSSLFDPGKEKAQELITDKLADDAFIETIKAAMLQNGYVFVSKV